MIRILLKLFLGLIFLGSCQPTSNQEQPGTEKMNQNDHATGFAITETTIIINEPWPGATQPQVFEIKGVPKRIVVTATTHLPFLEMLNVGDRLVGFPGTQYIYSNYFRKLVENNKIKDLGPDNQLNLELLLDLEPDMVIAFDMGGESAMLDKIQQAGIPILYNSDYLEQTILGRAEWIKVFGALFDRSNQADSIFNEISSKYDRYRNLIDKSTEKPKVLSGIMYGDTWFMPGGNNGTAQLITDAGGHYVWADNDQNGWLELSFESVYEKAGDADYWLGVGTVNSKNELIGLDQRYKSFAPLKEGKVFNYSRRISPGGGYDYFESGYARPDLILADLMAILHPQLMPDHDFTYFESID